MRLTPEQKETIDKCIKAIESRNPRLYNKSEIKESKLMDLDDLVFIISIAMNVRIEDIKRKGRGVVEMADARKVCMYFAYKYSGLTLKEIGRYFSRDHSTVHEAISTAEGYIKTDKVFKGKVEEIEKTLREKLSASTELKYNWEIYKETENQR
jgi:chromosomal replication initiation ATPase DnaA